MKSEKMWVNCSPMKYNQKIENNYHYDISMINLMQI